MFQRASRSVDIADGAYELTDCPMIHLHHPVIERSNSEDLLISSMMMISLISRPVQLIAKTGGCTYREM